MYYYRDLVEFSAHKLLAMFKSILAKSSIFVVVSAVAFLVLPSKASAREVCFTQYGGGETCVNVDEDSQIKVDKKILNPKSDQYEDHIKASGGSYPYKFSEGEKIEFQITVRNIGDVKLVNIKLTDVLPSFVKYKSGDGEKNKDGTEVEFDIGSLDPDEKETVEFTAKIASDGILPKDDRLCLTNIAKVKAIRDDDRDKKESAVDYANFCVELPKVLGKESIKVLPTTGGVEIDPEKLAILAIASGLMLVGFGIKRITSK